MGGNTGCGHSHCHAILLPPIVNVPYGLSCQCDEHMIANCTIPGNEACVGLLCTTLLAMLMLCTGGDDSSDEESDDRPSGMYN